MTDLPYIHARAEAPARRIAWRVILYAAVGTAGIAGVLAGRRAGIDTAGIEWQLVFLLRFMAVVKGGMVLGALALTQWRVARTISSALAAAYALALAAMALAPGLIWSPAAIVPGAGAFHAGLLLYLVLAWRDGAVSLPRRP